MFDHLPCLTQEILFLTQGSDLSPDLDPDPDLEQIWIGHFNVIIVIAWAIQQTIVSENRIEPFLTDNLIKVGEILLSGT